MRTARIHDVRYNDRLARKRRRRFLFRILFWTVFIILIVSAGFYIFLFSSSFRVKNIEITGLSTIDSGTIRARIDGYISEKSHKYLQLNRNMILIDTESLVLEFMKDYSVLKSVSVEKDIPDTVRVIFVERKPLGSWCFGEDCRYFDDQGVTWGQPAKSTGTLLMTVDDLRSDAGGKINPDMLSGVISTADVLAKIGIAMKSIRIPDGKFGEFDVFTARGFYIMMSTDSNINEQLKGLKILFEQKNSSSFSPQYIDIRYDGRIYYK